MTHEMNESWPRASTTFVARKGRPWRGCLGIILGSLIRRHQVLVGREFLADIY